MMGIDPVEQRPRMEESLEVILQLLAIYVPPLRPVFKTEALDGDLLLPGFVRRSTEFSKALERRATVFAAHGESGPRADYDRATRALLQRDELVLQLVVLFHREKVAGHEFSLVAIWTALDNLFRNGFLDSDRNDIRLGRRVDVDDLRFHVFL